MEFGLEMERETVENSTRAVRRKVVGGIIVRSGVSIEGVHFEWCVVGGCGVDVGGLISANFWSWDISA